MRKEGGGTWILMTEDGMFLQLLLIEKKFNELHPLLAQVGPIIDAWQGSLQQKEYLKVFFLVLQVCQCLMLGQVSLPQFGT